MKVITSSKITSVVADSEDSSYPDDNVLDEHPKRVWKGNSVDTATLTCQVSTGANTLAIFNTNAEQASVSITDPNLIEWDNADWDNATWTTAAPAVNFELVSQGSSKTLWATLDTTSLAAEIAISLSTATGTVIEAGVVVIGTAETFKDPQYGIQQGLQDYSVISQLANGATYYNQRDIVRTFSGQFIPERDTEFYDFMHDYARTYGMAPKAWRFTDQDNFEWVCYARLAAMPQGSHSYPSHSPITFQFIEVL